MVDCILCCSKSAVIIQISLSIISTADVWILSKFNWRLFWTWWILARKLELTDHSSQNHEIPSGWPLGLGIMNMRLRVLQRFPASAAAEPYSLHVASTSFSSFSSSNLDTEVTQNSHCTFSSFHIFFFYVSACPLLLSKLDRNPDNFTVWIGSNLKSTCPNRSWTAYPPIQTNEPYKNFLIFTIQIVNNPNKWGSESIKILVDTLCHLIETFLFVRISAVYR